jgi:1-acyl-sn-glycerol-3-phosphate acyltransferase
MMLLILYNLLIWPLFIILMVLYAPLIALSLLFPRDWVRGSRVVGFFMQIIYWLIIKLSFLPITIKGLENISDAPSIVVANHQSSMDIPLVGYLLDGYPHVWLAWINLMKSPFLRIILPRLAVLVDMSSPAAGMRTLREAIRVVGKTNAHAIIFPEGSRYTDGQVHEFYNGFTVLARLTNRPVIPIRIFGLNKVYPPEGWVVHYYPVKVIVGSPMSIQEGETEDAFKARVYEWFVQQTEN